MLAVDLLIIVPLVAALACVVAGGRAPLVPRWIALAAALSQVVSLIFMAGAGAFSGERFSGVNLGAANGLWDIAVDGLSAPLLALTAFTGIVAVSASWRIEHRPGAHFGLLALLQGAVAAVFLADHLILFYIAWESVLVPMFLLIGGWGSADARRASLKFLVYTFAGGAVLLAGIIYVISATGADSIAVISAAPEAIPLPGLAFWLLAVGFLVKLPAVPVHTWLPDAHTEAPTAGSIVLAAVLLKMGGYGLIRIALPLAPAGFESARWVLLALGLTGIVWGAAAALVQSDLKRLIAYSSVAHMGFVLVAVAVGTPAALGAALVTMVSHGVVAAMLFYLVGALYERAHTRELSRFGGLGSVTPRWSTAFVFAALASAGLPGLSGFPGEFIAFTEGFAAFGWWMLVAAVGIVLAAAYNLRSVRATVQGPVGGFGELSDMDARESATSALFAAAIVALGVAPWLVTAAAGPVLELAVAFVGGAR